MPEPGDRIKKQPGDYHKNHSADSKDENRVVGDRTCRRTISFENVGHSARAIGKDWSCGHAQRKEYEPGFSNQPAIIRNEKLHRAFLAPLSCCAAITHGGAKKVCALGATESTLQEL